MPILNIGLLLHASTCAIVRRNDTLPLMLTLQQCLQVDLAKVWVMFSSIVLAFAFMFGNSVKTVYESIIYLFVVHPFDVGDKIIVDSVSSKVHIRLLA